MTEFNIEKEIKSELAKFDAIRAAERELIAKYVESRAHALGDKADMQDNHDDAIELKANAWMLLVLAQQIRDLGKS